MISFKYQALPCFAQLQNSQFGNPPRIKPEFTIEKHSTIGISGLTVLIILSGIAFIPTVEAQDKKEKVTIQHGTVVGVEKLDNKTQKEQNRIVGAGALIGGTLGLLTSRSNRSSGSIRRRGLAGAGIGAAAGAVGATVSAKNKPQQGTFYTVKVGNETIKVVTDQKGINMHDCVTVEKGGTNANLRHASPEVCNPKSKAVVEDLKSEFQQEADECLAAKKELVNTKEQEALDRAIRKVKIVCGS
ncbi:hypothetical protein ACFL17_06445 [Pseudomonadota bacterium]